MLDKQRILAVVPARGGSKGISLKNLHPILGRPMISYVGDIVRALSCIDRVVVSTDHEEIARVAEAAGIAAPFRRPVEISGDRIADKDVLLHALQTMEQIDGCIYDIVLMLQPTSPLRRPEHVQQTLDMLRDGHWDAVWTLSETDSKNHPLKQITVRDRFLNYYDPDGERIVARQQLEPVYHRNGIAYAVTRKCLIELDSIKGHCTGGLVLDGNFVSIDTEWDVALVEFILGRRGKDLPPSLF